MAVEVGGANSQPELFNMLARTAAASETQTDEMQAPCLRPPPPSAFHVRRLPNDSRESLA